MSELKKEERKEEENDAPKKNVTEISWKDFYKDKNPKERYYLLKEELERVIEKTNARRKEELEKLRSKERGINFIATRMDEGVWCGQSCEDAERIIAEKNACHKAERETEQEKAGIIAEMEAIIKAEKLKIKPDGTLH